MQHYTEVAVLLQGNFRQSVKKIKLTGASLKTENALSITVR